MISDAQIGRRTTRRVIRIPGRHADAIELVVVFLIEHLRTAHAIQAFTVEGDVLGQPLIDGDGAAGEL